MPTEHMRSGFGLERRVWMARHPPHVSYWSGNLSAHAARNVCVWLVFDYNLQLSTGLALRCASATSDFAIRE